jgi:geranylgeranyl reductase family protein
VPADEAYVQNKVKGARFFSPSGLTFTIEKKETVACVIDRSIFDRFLAQKTAETGARISLNEQAKGIERSEKETVIRSENKKFYSKMVIDAEGASSRILKVMGLKPLNHDSLVPGIQCDFENVGVDPEHIEVHFGNRIAPRFFAWVIPLSENKARVGLGCKGESPKERLDEFVRKRFGFEKNLGHCNIRSGSIITGGPINRTFNDRFLVVGDAAGQVKPTTGGGVILGGLCASIAGRIAAEAVDRGDCATSFLGRYETLWKDKLGKDFRSMLLARKVVNRLSDKAINKLFNAVIEENLQGIFSAEGDMDFQSAIILKMLRKKEILGILPSFLRALVPF